MSGGHINATELTAAIINQKDSITEGIRYAQERIDGSMTLLILTKDGRLCRPRPPGPHPACRRKKGGRFLRIV